MRGSALWLALALAGCQVPLNTGLQESDANDMVAVLLAEGITVSKVPAKDNRVDLMVDEDRFADAVNLLKARGLPRDRFASLETVFKQEGLISTPAEEAARFLYARGQELAHSISTIEGVLSARVHIASPKRNSPFDKADQQRASVLVRVNAMNMADGLVPQIKRLVAFGVEGLGYDDVSVMLTPVHVEDRSPALDTFLGSVVHKSAIVKLRILFSTLLLLGVVAASAALILFVQHRKRLTHVKP